jgi:small subunit ribosomal protein S17
MIKMTKTKKTEKMEKKEIVDTCKDKNCPIHGNLKTRGKTFKGIVISKHEKRIAIEIERMVYIKKYERYAKSKAKIHARLPSCMEKNTNIGDLVKIQECRPLSKIVHFVVIKKLKDVEEFK